MKRLFKPNEEQRNLLKFFEVESNRKLPLRKIAEKTNFHNIANTFYNIKKLEENGFLDKNKLPLSSESEDYIRGFNRGLEEATIELKKEVSKIIDSLKDTLSK